VAITQSGETVDTLAAMHEAMRSGAKVVAVCNTEGSQATRAGHGTVFMRCEPEVAVASTKTFLGSLAALYLLACYVGQRRDFLTDEKLSSALDDLASMPNLVGRALKTEPAVMAVVKRFYEAKHFLFLGRGLQFPLALEGALKLKEISYIHAEGYAAGEMKHGPIALIDEQMPVVALATHDHVFEKMQGNIQEAKARGGSIIAITTKGDTTLKELLDDGDSLIEVPSTNRLLMPVVISLPLQLLSYYIAVRRGCDVDQPRNLAKSVTVE
jgi:glucosamine--fructose-6-phosphate aminotransferase (isomerizing)